MRMDIAGPCTDGSQTVRDTGGSCGANLGVSMLVRQQD